MTKTIFSLAIALCTSSLIASSQTADNAELKQMFEEDQRGRTAATIDWDRLVKEDSFHQVRVHQMIDSGKVLTGQDYYHSAMIFQHGSDSVAYGMAVKHMRMAIALDKSVNKWLLAAAIDRDLTSRNQPQIYGTQYIRQGLNTKWKLCEIDTTKVTDKERLEYGVESLAQQRVKERELNLLEIPAYYSKSQSLNQTLTLIKREYKRGQKSHYNVSEARINDFGYQ